MKRALPVILLAVVAAVVYFNYSAWFAEEAANGPLTVSGNIEATEAMLSFKLNGRIEELLVEEGQWVEEGERLARLDDADYRQQVALDQANLRVAQAQLNLTQAGARPQEIEAAEQTVLEAEAEVEQRQIDLERAEGLYNRDAGSKQALDSAKTARTRAQATLLRAREVHSQLAEGARAEEIAIAQANVRRARETLKFSRIRLEQTELRAPTGGVVLVKQAEAGEVVAPGSPILTLGDLDNVWLRAYISETNLGRITWGQRATLRIDTFPEKTYEGRISFISSKAEFTPKTIETHEERVKLVYRIKISVENQNQELKPGMPADAVIETNGAIDTSGKTADGTSEQESEQD